MACSRNSQRANLCSCRANPGYFTARQAIFGGARFQCRNSIISDVVVSRAAKKLTPLSRPMAPALPCSIIVPGSKAILHVELCISLVGLLVGASVRLGPLLKHTTNGVTSTPHLTLLCLAKCTWLTDYTCSEFGTEDHPSDHREYLYPPRGCTDFKA